MMNLDPQELARVQRQTVRRVASILVKAMAETDSSLEDIDFRLGQTSGWAKDTLDQLIAGNGNISLNPVSDFAFAMGVELRFGLEPLPPVVVPEPEAKEAQ